MTLQQTILLTLQASVIITVFGFGLDAKVDDVLREVRQPSRLLRALAAMFVVMPLLAIGLDKAFEFRHEVEIALGALALSPVPPLLPRKQDKATGEGSSGLGLMATMALLSIVIIPLGVALAGPVFHRSFAMPPATIAKLIFMVAILPLLAGMAVGALLPSKAQRIFKPIRMIANILLLATALLIVWSSRQAVIAQIGDGTLYALTTFIIVGLVAGHLLGGPAPRDRAVLALSTASRHPGIALALASANFPEVHNVTATVLLYLLLNVALSVPYVMWQKRRLGGAAVTAG